MKRFFSGVFKILSVLVCIAVAVIIIILASKQTKETSFDFFAISKDTRVFIVQEIDLYKLSQEGEWVVTDKFLEEKWDMIIVGKMKVIEMNRVNRSTICFLGIKSGKFQISPKKFEMDFLQEIKEISYKQYENSAAISISFGKNWNMTWLFILATVLFGFLFFLFFHFIAYKLTGRFYLPPLDLTVRPNVQK